MNSREESRVGDLRSLTLLKLLWGIFTVLNGFLASFFGIFIFMGIINLPYILSPNRHIGMGFTSHSAVFLGLVGVVMWVLFVVNIKITFGLFRLDYFRWKLLVIELVLIEGVLIFFMLYYVILYPNRIDYLMVFLFLMGFFLVLLYLAVAVREKFFDRVVPFSGT